MILFLAFVCIWCFSCQVECVHTRPRCCKASSSCRLDSRRQLFKVCWPLYDSIAFGNTCKELLIPWCVILVKNMTTFTSVLGAPRLSMILTTCLTRTLFLSPSNTGSVVALLISQTPYVLDKCDFRLGMFGFLSTETKDAPGNYGMLDQVSFSKSNNQWPKRNQVVTNVKSGCRPPVGETAHLCLQRGPWQHHHHGTAGLLRHQHHANQIVPFQK